MFTLQYITSVNPPVQHGTQLLLSWTASVSGLTFQVYVAGALVWSGRATAASIPLPPLGAPASIVVGSIGPGDSPSTSFAASLPMTPDRTTTLAWLGGTFESAAISHFAIYGSAAANGPVVFGATPLAVVPAYAAGIVTDGYGVGPYGAGGYGLAAGSYSWTSASLTSGAWNWAVVPIDTAGNAGAPAFATDVIRVPPCEVPPNVAGLRLTYVYSMTTHEVVLNWLASSC